MSSLRVTTRRWSNSHGAGRVTATCRGVRRTVAHDPATSGGMSGDGDHMRAVRAVLAALHIPTDVPVALVTVTGARRTYKVEETR